MTMKPKTSSEKELDKAQEQFDAFDQSVKEMTLDRMNKSPLVEVEPQSKIARSDIDKMKDVYLKPKRSIRSREQFNERFRDEYERSKKYVQFIAENIECKGDRIDSFWTKPFPGLAAEEWEIPVGRPVWAPMYVAERIRGCKHHRLVMQNTTTAQDGMAQYYGTMAVDTTIQRFNAYPVSDNKNFFFGT